MPVRISAAAAIIANDAINDTIDGGTGGTSKVTIYNGAKPADPSVAVGSQTKLVEFPLPSPCFTKPSTSITDAAQNVANAIADAVAVAGGTATWFRVTNKSNVAVQDGDVTDTAGSGAMKVANTTIVLGVSVKIVSWTTQHPQ